MPVTVGITQPCPLQIFNIQSPMMPAAPVLQEKTRSLWRCQMRWITVGTPCFGSHIRWTAGTPCAVPSASQCSTSVDPSSLATSPFPLCDAHQRDPFWDSRTGCWAVPLPSHGALPPSGPPAPFLGGGGGGGGFEQFPNLDSQ